MSRWPIVTLSDVMVINVDAVPSSELDSVNLAGIYGFGRGLFKRGLVSPMETTYKAFHRLHEGDFVISTPKAWEGAISRIEAEFEGWFLSPVFPTFKGDSEFLDTRFLDWYCKRESVWEELSYKAKGIGARRESVTALQFLSLKIPLPTLDEQRAIVTRLDAVAEKARQVEAKLDGIEADAEALIISLHYELAAGHVIPLGEILELSEQVEPLSPDDEYPQVGVRGFGGGLFTKLAIRSTETTYKAFNRLYRDALVLSQVKGWEGALAFCPESLAGMYVSPEYRTFRCLSGKANPAYLNGLIKTPWFWRLLQDATRGVGARRERTRPEQFLGLKLPMPSFAEQVTGAEIFARLEKTKAKHAETRQSLKALLPSMLEQLFGPGQSHEGK